MASIYSKYTTNFKSQWNMHFQQTSFYEDFQFTSHQFDSAWTTYSQTFSLTFIQLLKFMEKKLFAATKPFGQWTRHTPNASSRFVFDPGGQLLKLQRAILIRPNQISNRFSTGGGVKCCLVIPNVFSPIYYQPLCGIITILTIC